MAVVSLVTAMACRDSAVPTVTLVPPAAQKQVITESAGFYQTSDGYYYWDGQPPVGDASPAEIISATAGGYAPAPNTGGWVAGTVSFIGDQYKMEIIYSLSQNDSVIYRNSRVGNDWTRPFPLPGRDVQEGRYEYLLRQISPDCGYALTSGGTAWARKSVPFGISLSLIKPSLSLNFGSISWGEVSYPMTAYANAGPLCDEDLSQYTRPVPGDPANAPLGPMGGTGGTPTNQSGVTGSSSSWPSGAGSCIGWIDWYMSWDNDRTRTWVGWQCTEWAS